MQVAIYARVIFVVLALLISIPVSAKNNQAIYPSENSANAPADENVPFEELGGDQCFMFSGLVHYEQEGDHYVGQPVELVINNEEDYKKLFDPKLMRQSCANIDLSKAITKVDFSKKTVLGLFSGGSCAATGFERKVVKDYVQKKIIYSVSVFESPIACSGPGLEGLNLIAIPKIPEGYMVIFQNNPSSEAGGVTVTGVTNTTTYTPPGPTPVVSAINGIPITQWPSGSVASPTPAPAQTGNDYDESMRKSLNMPIEWFACKTSVDCVLAHVPCGTDLAVGKDHIDEAETSIYKGGYTDACLMSLGKSSSATCNNGQCVTVIKQ